MTVTALGMIETIGLVSAIEAADAGLKAADVRLLGTDYVRGGLVMVRFEGDVAAVQAAVDAGACAAKRVGSVFSAHVIPRAMPEVFCMLASDVSEGPGKLHSGGCAQCGGCEGGRRECAAIERMRKEKKLANESEANPSESTSDYVQHTPNTLETEIENIGSMKVLELRRLARRIPDLQMTSNEIRYANKRQLLDAINRWHNKEV